VIILQGIKHSTKKKTKAFYSDESSDSSSSSVVKLCPLDPDHDLLLRSCMPLLQSRNTAVNINCLLVVKSEGLYAYGLIRILHSIKGGSISGQNILLSCPPTRNI